MKKLKAVRDVHGLMNPYQTYAFDGQEQAFVAKGRKVSRCGHSQKHIRHVPSPYQRRLNAMPEMFFINKQRVQVNSTMINDQNAVSSDETVNQTTPTIAIESSAIPDHSDGPESIGDQIDDVIADAVAKSSPAGTIDDDTIADVVEQPPTVLPASTHTVRLHLDSETEVAGYLEAFSRFCAVSNAVINGKHKHIGNELVFTIKKPAPTPSVAIKFNQCLISIMDVKNLNVAKRFIASLIDVKTKA